MAMSNDMMEGLSACECPVCFNFLSERLPPMSMPCGHTLCSHCVDQLVVKATNENSKATPTFRCPLCREWVNRDAVSLNHTLKDLIAQLTSIGVNPGNPETHQARVLSALHVNFTEVTMGASLDRGAFGEVYRGSWRGNDVAVKMFSSGIMTPEAMQAFQREVFVMNCLRHPNVVLLMGACQTPPKLAIIMEFVAGGSLHKLIHVDKVKLSLEQCCSLGGDICRGLQYLHSINILHRDLKSKNVLLSAMPPTGQAKLCDFGLARMRLESATLTGNVGTVHWSAPEVLANHRYKFPADVYSLGMVIYEMTCGRIPFHSMVPLAVMMAVALKKEKPELPPETDPRIAEIISDCISWDPNERPSVGAVLSSLLAITPPHTLTATQERRAHLSHSDSLGMVFVSVTDSVDLGNQDNELVGVAHNMGLLSPEQVERSVSEEDRTLAWQLTVEEQDAQVARDEELAHQLQLRENAYLTPSDTKVKVSPPQKVLDSIKSMTKQPFKSRKEAPPSKVSEPPARLKTAGKVSEPPAKLKTASKVSEPPAKLKTASKVSEPPAKLKTASKVSEPPAKLKSISKSAELPTLRKTTSRVSEPHTKLSRSSEPPTQLNTKKQSPTVSGSPKLMSSKSVPTSQSKPGQSAHSSYKSVAKKLKKLVHHSSSSNTPPPPPSPPPPPPPPRAPPPPAYPLPTAGKMWSSKRQLLREVRSKGLKVAQRLRPVETVEKRAFRVGRVVDGYSSERSQYTVQNQISSFNHKLLHHVILIEPPPPFPVGKVLPPSRGQNVKRMSSIIESLSSLEGASETTPRKSLHPAVQQEIEVFRPRWLKPVHTDIKNSLPTAEDIVHERELVTMPPEIDQSNSLAVPRLHPLIQSSIIEFDRRSLRHVNTSVKQRLPTKQDIAVEKSMEVTEEMESADSAPTSASPQLEPTTQNDEQLELEEEKLQGFW